MNEPHNPELPRKLADRLAQRFKKLDDSENKIVTEVDLTEHMTKTKESFEALAVVNDLTLDKIYLVYSRKRHSVLHDPMTNKPVHSRHRNYLEEIAKQFKGEIVTAREALKRLEKHLK